MADAPLIEEFPLDETPSSVAVGNLRYLWITAVNSIFKVNPNDLENAEPIPPGRSTVGVIKDPESGNKRIWMAAGNAILMMETYGRYPVTTYRLDESDRASTVTLLTTDEGGPGTPVDVHRLLFTGGQSSIGVLPIPALGGSYSKILVGENTRIVDVTVTTVEDEDGKKAAHTYWAISQKQAGDPDAIKNGLYRRLPEQTAWEKIDTLGISGQTPHHIIADTEAVWLTATNPNQVIRYSIADGHIKTVDLDDAVPGRLVFYADDTVWVASNKGLHEIDRHDPGTDRKVDLPKGGYVKDLCVGTNAELWYTNPENKSLGKYLPPPPPPPGDGGSRIGRTQVVSQGESAVRVQGRVERPLVAEYVANGCPVPGIPLTCRIEAEGATFDDGSREQVILTNQLGRVTLPPVVAGPIEETAVLSAGLGDTEPHATTTLRIVQE
ncbi:hypothetical protein [Streptomyces sp. NPDC001678]|uniref:hypothetical protein n=1 Tax=Streptomyces sp. NPDC001678 TaxID=3364599 RepID=UPI0036C7C1DB